MQESQPSVVVEVGVAGGSSEQQTTVSNAASSTSTGTCRVVGVSADEFSAYRDSLATLLHACVQGGASVNFLLPFSIPEAVAFWDSQLDDIRAGRTILCIASPAAASDGVVSSSVLGCVLVKLATQPNQRHRVDIGKMLVSPNVRRQGIGKLLLDAAEAEAIKHGRWLLVGAGPAGNAISIPARLRVVEQCLDTEAESPAERLYLKQGYVAVGTIPDYALLNDGTRYTATTIMYKHLGREATRK